MGSTLIHPAFKNYWIRKEDSVWIDGFDTRQWRKEQELVFNLLKENLCFTPLFILPNFGKTFKIEYDAFGMGIDAILCDPI